MQFRAEEYYQASLERMRQARDLHARGENWALAMYCAGLAVECMLRAFRWTEETTFEGRHDLVELLRASGLLRTDEESMRARGETEEAILTSGRKLRAAMNEVVSLWHNNLRFVSEARLKAHLKTIGRDRGVRGDPRKKNARDLLEAAQTVIDRGTALWTSKRKSSRH